MQYPIRINKYLRDKGFASRREADELIEAGKVFVDGRPAKTGMMVNEKDVIELRQTAKKGYRYLAYYKPRGLPTQGVAGQESVITNWREKGLFPVGRLDKESEGLIILTNDRRQTEKILGAESGMEKEYLVRVREDLRSNVPAIFAKGMHTESLGELLPAKASLEGDHTLRVILHEGKKHQIRVMLSELGYTVESLKRLRIGRITLGRLKSGGTRELKQSDF